MSADVVPIVLAAGASSRMGSPKAGLDLDGRTFLRWILDAAADAGLAPAVVVAGAHPEAVRAASLGAALAPVHVLNPAWARGRTTSLRAGLAALLPDTRAFLLWPVDAPLAGEALGALVAARRDGPAGSLGWVPVHEGRRGHPILLDRSVASDLVALSDDASAREVVRALAAAGRLAHVPAGPRVLDDVDGPEDLGRLRASIAGRAGP